jgi:hypothetical protein
MAETTRNEGAEGGADLVAAARERGMEQLEGAKGQLAEGAERVASAVDRTADALEDDGDSAISGFGHSVASLMRQLAGGLRERDIDDFARELADLARRNPGVFLAGSVALGFGIARFFKARVPQSSSTYAGESWQSTSGWQDLKESAHGRPAYDAEEDLDLSESSTQRRDTDALQGDSGSQRAGGWQDGSGGWQNARPQSDASVQSAGASQSGSSSQEPGAARDDEQPDRNASKSRQSSKQKAKPQRASSGGSQHAPPSTEPPSTDGKATGATAGSTESAFTGGTGGGALRGGKS